jgi:hypothetical protein
MAVFLPFDGGDHVHTLVVHTDTDKFWRGQYAGVAIESHCAHDATSIASGIMKTFQ